MDRQQHIKLALSEDQYKKDITTKILPLDKKCKAIIKAKESFYIYGLKWFSDVFKSVNKSTKIKFKRLNRWQLNQKMHNDFFKSNKNKKKSF